MVEFENSEGLVKFIDNKLPPKIHKQLFFRKYTWMHKGKEYEGTQNKSAFFIYSKLVNLGFAHGVCKQEFSSYPDIYVLHWTELNAFIEQNDTLPQEQQKYSLLTINAACEFLSVTRPTLYKLIQQGEFRTVQVLTQKRIQFKDLNDYIERNKR